MSKWILISDFDYRADAVDLFGYIAYDCTEMRLTDCERIDNFWHYFCAGEMLRIDTISFTPTHWMPLPDDPQ